MKHTHCHCGLREQLSKFKAGKLGILGGILIIGHLLFHVAECLILPAIFLAASGNAESSETSEQLLVLELQETTFANLVKALSAAD